MFHLNGPVDEPTPTMAKATIDADNFLAKVPSPSSSDLVNLLKPYGTDDRNAVAQVLIARGVTLSTVVSALTFLDAAGKLTKGAIWGLLSTASAAISGFHGMRRNNGSVGWGLWWFVMGGLFPVVTPVFALAQKPGFAKSKGG